MSITITDLRARDLRVQWFEAVAIVQAISAAALEARPDEPRFPDLDAVRIDADGEVEAAPGGELGARAVERAARAMCELVPESDMPVPLRLAVVTALSPTTSAGSLREFYDAMEFYERPDRHAQIRGLYARWEASPVLAVPTPPPVVPVPPAAAGRKGQPAPRAPVSRRTRFLVAAALGAVVLAGAVSLFLWLNPLARQRTAAAGGTARSVLASALDRARETVSAGVEGIGRQVGLVAEDPPPAVEPEPAAVPAAAAPRRRPAALPAVPLEPGETAGLGHVPVAPEPPALGVAPAERPAASAIEEPVLTVIYSAADRDVTPPVLLRPQLPTQPPPGLSWSDLPVMEVVVDSDGSVISARLQSAPRRVQDGMLLSAAKAWTFAPALKDGRPVVYRASLWITLP